MLEPFLVTNNLFGYVNGTISCPPQHLPNTTSKEAAEGSQPAPPRVNPDYTTWVANDAHVRMLIISTISEASFQHVQGTTSRDVWLSLESAYAPHTSSREYTLKTQLLKIEMKSDESSTAYLNRAKEYSNALANIGESMKEKDVIMLVVSGLWDEYNTFKSTFLTRPPLQFSELYGLLSDHDYMLKKNQPDVPPVQAFVGTTTNKNNSTPAASSDQITALQQLLSQFGLQVQQQPGAPAAAFYANRGGSRGGRGNRNQNQHRGNSNGSSGRSQSNGGGNRNNHFPWASNQNTVFGTCNRCGIGHIPSECPNRDPSTYRRTTSQANYADVTPPPPCHVSQRKAYCDGGARD